MKEINVAILGFGTVGQGTARIIIDNASQWMKKCGADIKIRKVLVRNLNQKRMVDLPPGTLTDKWEDIIADRDIQVVIEVMGGIEPAKKYILEAISQGKNIITANKDLLADHGEEIFNAANQYGVDVYFEASVAGGIPIIMPLKKSLAANNILQVMGIVNGTTNYILTKMSKEKMSYDEALKRAQELGYAEADPAADVGGYDAARKIAILASIAFHTRVKLNDVFIEGITNLTARDIQFAQELGYAVKLLGIARENKGKIEVRVHPALISANHPLANVNDSFNAVFVQGDAVGETMFFGRGAGQMPTASSVAGDLVSIANNIRNNSTGQLGCTCYEHKEILSILEIHTKYYLRLYVVDRPGVLASIAGVFGENGVSLASVLQKNSSPDNIAELVVITHAVKERDIQNALETIRNMPITKSIGNLIRVEEN